MSKKKATDWFTVYHQFNIAGAGEFFSYLNSEATRLLREIDESYEQSLSTQPNLARDMLESIGVKTDAKSR